MAIESSTSALAAIAPHDDEDRVDGEPSAEDEAEEAELNPIHIATDRAKGRTLRDDLILQIDDINLARYIEQDELDRIGDLVVREYRIDELSRSDWMDLSRKAMKYAIQKTTAKNYPWPNASNAIYPLIGQAAIEFAARTYPALIQNRSVVKGVVWGSDNGTPITTDGSPNGPPRLGPPGPQGQPPQPVWRIAPGEKRKRADRISEHMSWQLLDEIPEWEPQTDQMLHQAPIVGGFVRKTFFDPVQTKNRSLAVSLGNLVWNMKAPAFEKAPRHTEKLIYYPNEITTMERTVGPDDDDGAEGMFLELNYGPGDGTIGEGFDFDEDEGSGDQSDEDAPHMFIAQHRRLDLDDDGYEEPYIVTVHLRSAKVVRIEARYDKEGVKSSARGKIIREIVAADQFTLYPFLPAMDGGSYPTGFGHLLKPMSDLINSSLNQMFDAATLQNSGGGFISDQLGLPSGQTLFSVGKYTRVTAKGMSIKDAVLPLPFPGPSETLFKLFGVLVAAGKEIASIGNILAGDAAMANAPPTTILALIEQGMKIYTAIHKRLWRAEKAELDKLYRLNRLHITDNARYMVGDDWREVTAEDYRLGGGVEPIADPTMTTDMQKLGRAQILMGFKDDPLINQVEIRRRMFEAANVDRIEDLFAPPPRPDPNAVALQQLEIQMAQAKLGSERAKELKDQTQAFLNMALARKNASAQEEAYIDAQLDYLRLHIEAVNSTIKAATLDHKYHDTDTRAATARASALATTPAPAADGLTPGPTGPFPLAPSAPPGQAVNKPVGPSSAIQGGAPDAVPILPPGAPE